MLRAGLDNTKPPQTCEHTLKSEEHPLGRGVGRAVYIVETT